jgi:malonyl-CoA decarboxylase
VPTFARWLDRLLADDSQGVVTAGDREALHELKDPGWWEHPSEALKSTLMALAAHYFLAAKSVDGRPVDPVARFHLGNGARLERINWLGDVSEKGLREAHGLMVNYRYELKDIERNHEAFANEGVIAISRAVRGFLRPVPRLKLQAGEPARLPAPEAEPATAAELRASASTAAAPKKKS